MGATRVVSCLLRQPYFPLETGILGLGGMILAIAALLLEPAVRGSFPYYINGLYGLLLVLFAFQIVALGKTPLGEFGRSFVVLAGGGAVAAVGVAACCIPSFQQIPRLVLLACFGGGFVLLLRLLTERERIRQWWALGGIFRHLLFSSSAVYVLSMLTALILWQEEGALAGEAAGVLSLYAIVLFYLAAVLRKIYFRYPGSDAPKPGGTELSAAQAVLLLLSLFMILLGLLLVPVSLGWLPFSSGAQLGLLMVFFSLQMLAAGETPLGPFPRNWLLLGCSILFAAAGLISCLLPELLVAPLTLWVGMLNITNGSVTLRNCWRTARQPGETPPPQIALVGGRLFKAQLLLGLLALLFGTSMLLPGFIPELVTGLILAANGAALFGLVYLLLKLETLLRC